MHEIQTVIQTAIKDVFNTDIEVVLTRPDEQFGDYATNAALQLSKQLGKNSREIAESIAVKTRENSSETIADISVAGPGFLNIQLTDSYLLQSLSQDISTLSPYKRVLLEYSCPNAFKELHTGHLYQTIAGDTIGRILEATGAKVFRANFGGDVGLHVAKCLYGIVNHFGGPKPELLANVGDVAERPEWISKMYVAGATAYENDETAKAEITAINQQIYDFHTTDDHDSPLAQIYWTCRTWSYDYFKSFYELVEVKPFDKYYPESSTSQPGLELVKAHTDVFKESDGAVVFEGEAVGLHTRVFITSKGLPTYEAKDLGVIATEVQDFEYDKRVLITGNDQTEYMKVVFAALEQIDADLAHKQTHFTNGTVRFGTGQKMSSRLGNVTRAIDVIETTRQSVAASGQLDPQNSTALAAIKYSFLKYRLGGDIAFDVTESVSLEGNSGPYLQYAHARGRSILAKADSVTGTLSELQPTERALVRKISEFTEVVQHSVVEFMPHYICTYLYELSQAFNRFYEKNRVIGDAREAERLVLVKYYVDTLKSGLALLGIQAPDRM